MKSVIEIIKKIMIITILLVFGGFLCIFNNGTNQNYFKNLAFTEIKEQNYTIQNNDLKYIYDTWNNKNKLKEAKSAL